MIPFASQRGSGQDLATHLLNEHDNEYMELADLRGSVADDLHGAFAEWEAEASAMTKCANYLYSLSVNPDPAQGPMSRDLYDDYIVRVEKALGLEGQPRAVVFHIKEDRAGVPREHCHVVWSRIDVLEMKAIHMAFDHDKLMTVTRQFARDHDIELAPGYHKLEDRKRQTYRQLSLYEKAQQESIGLTKEERRAIVTELWHGRDTPESFIKALEYHGYTLAIGRRPFVLVDIYGHTNSLPKLIDDKTANTEAIRAFLGEEYDEDNLPSVEDAQELAAKHRKALKEFKQLQIRADELDQLKEIQNRRREKVEREIEALREQHKQARMAFEARQRGERDTLRGGYLEQVREIRRERQENKPQGLAGFLAKVSGMELVQRKYHKYQDRRRHDAFLGEKHALRDRQTVERDEHRRAQEMQALDLERKHRALEQTEQREIRSLETAQQKQQFVQNRAAYEHMPSPQLKLSPPGRKAVPHKAKNRYTSAFGREIRRPASVEQRGMAESGADTLRRQFKRSVENENSPRNGEKRTDLLASMSIPTPQKHIPENPPARQAIGGKSAVESEQKAIEKSSQSSDRSRKMPNSEVQLDKKERQSLETGSVLQADEQSKTRASDQPNTIENLKPAFDNVSTTRIEHDNASISGTDKSSPEPSPSDHSPRNYAPTPEQEPDRER